MNIVDAYLHCGLRKYQPIEVVRATMDSAGVSRAVIVQHLGEFDNSYVGSVIESDPNRFAGVCLVDPASPGAADALRDCSHSGLFQGTRFTAETLQTAPELWHLAAELGMVIVLYAPEGVQMIVEALRDLLKRHTACKLVITHLGNPNVQDAPHFSRYRGIYTLAEFPGVYYQVSGMKMFCPYPHEALYPLISEASKAFGYNRLIWGSNFPVVGDLDDYKSDLMLLLSGALPMPEDAIPLIAGANARKLWFPD